MKKQCKCCKVTKSFSQFRQGQPKMRVQYERGETVFYQNKPQLTNTCLDCYDYNRALQGLCKSAMWSIPKDEFWEQTKQLIKGQIPKEYIELKVVIARINKKVEDLKYMSRLY